MAWLRGTIPAVARARISPLELRARPLKIFLARVPASSSHRINGRIQMALVTCPDCSAQVSDAAPSCPQCGRPVARSLGRPGYLNPSPTGTVVTIEKTGKGLKLQRLLAVMLLLTGIVMIISYTAGYAPNNNPVGRLLWGILAFVLAVLWLVMVRVKTWWRHG